MFIAKNVIITDISWDELDKKGLICGKEIEINGSTYTIRSLTSMEYDEHVVPRADEFNWSLFTWCVDIYSETLTGRVYRGGNSVSNFGSITMWNKHLSRGWRPVLIGDKPPERTAEVLLNQCGILGGEIVNKLEFVEV